MGLEFVRKAAPTFRKGLDLRRIELGTPTLFTQQPSCTLRAYAANLLGDQKLALGEKLGVHLDGPRILVLRGLDPVATFNSPPADLMDALVASHGEACGLVQEVHEIAGIAEITVC
jgi:hypothetical protein